jgi:CRISPR-associated protein Cmr4
VSCPRLLRRYASCKKPDLQGQQLEQKLPKPYTCSPMKDQDNNGQCKQLFFNLGMVELTIEDSLTEWMPLAFEHELQAKKHLVVVADADIGMIHDMALYRQSRVKMDDTQKTVKNFFNVEALPEASILIFPVACKPKMNNAWEPFSKSATEQTDETDETGETGETGEAKELYFSGLENIGFGRCQVIIPKSGSEMEVE